MSFIIFIAYLDLSCLEHRVSDTLVYKIIPRFLKLKELILVIFVLEALT